MGFFFCYNEKGKDEEDESISDWWLWLYWKSYGM